MTVILDNKIFSYVICSHVAVKPDPLRLSANQKKELFDFIKNTRNKEEYRRAVAVKQNMEGMAYRIIAKNLVNYRNVYYMIKSYKEYGLRGIKSKRKNAGRIPKISSEKNKQIIKDIILNKSPRTFGYLKNTWSKQALARKRNRKKIRREYETEVWEKI